MPSIPIVLVTGFLGSGKTTLMRRLIADTRRRGCRACVIVNEFGDADIDSHILRQADAELIASIAGGCACCTGQDELHETLLEIGLRAAAEQPAVILMEASGLADPVTLLDIVTAADLLALVHVASIVAVIDSGRFADLLDELEALPARQTQLADLVVLNKVDVAGRTNLASTEAAVRRLNPHARLEPALQCDFDLEAFWRRVLDPASYARPAGRAGPFEHGAHRAAHALVLPLPHPVDRARLESALAALPVQVWRVKGFAHLRGDGQLHLVQYTGGPGGGRFQIGAFHLLAGDVEPETALVFLGAALDRERIVSEFEALRAQAEY